SYLPKGATFECNLTCATLSATTTNNVVVIADGGLATGQILRSGSTTVVVGQASVAATLTTASPDDLDGNANDNHLTLPADGTAHSVSYSLTVQSGDAPLANIIANTGSLGCNFGTGFALAANSQTTIVCNATRNCNDVPAG